LTNVKLARCFACRFDMSPLPNRSGKVAGLEEEDGTQMTQICRKRLWFFGGHFKTTVPL